MPQTNNNEKPKNSFKRNSVIALLLLCLLIGLGLKKWAGHGLSVTETSETTTSGKEASESTIPEAVLREETISFGAAEEWENWADYLASSAKAAPYAFAFIQAGNASADFSWGFYDEREAFVSDFLEKKEGTDMPVKDKGSLPWYFVKLRLDDGIYGTNILEYMKQNLSDEGYEYMVCTLDSGGAYAIMQEWTTAFEEQYRMLLKREAVVCDGYMYFLACEGIHENNDNIEEINEQLLCFENQFNQGEFRTGTIMDEERLYWSDHTQRVTKLDNPTRAFTEEKAADTDNPDKLMGNFGLMREAEYQIRLAPDMPDMIINFQFAENIPEGGYETYLFNGFSMDEAYKMEVRNAKDDSLIQTTDVNLCIEMTDTVSFEDLDGDGCLEMKIIYPTHQSGSDSIEIHHKDYWEWDREQSKLVRTNQEELLAKRKENNASTDEEETPQVNLSVIPVTVEKGDCLWNIAAEYYGDGGKWIKIYEWNYPVIGDNPSLIYEGTELSLPWMRDWD